MMKTLYFDCSMGAAGDMLMGALLEIVPNPDEFLATMNSIGLPGVKLRMEKTAKCGITGTHLHVYIDGVEEGSVEGEHHGHSHEHHGNSHEHSQDHHEHSHEHHGSSLVDIEERIARLPLSDKVKNDAISVYRLIGGAEAKVHGQNMDHIHFHEVGTLDALADVVGNCLLMEIIGVERIVCSPIHVGSGHVHCAHGILPVPAPATALLLEGMHVYSQDIQGELCTPTGAALLKYFVQEFGSMPSMVPTQIGYGMGTKDFERANCVRVFLGDSFDEAKDAASDFDRSIWTNQVAELTVNLDDMTGEEIGFAVEVLMEEGVLDVWTQAVSMKKSRPGVLLTCLCDAEDKERIATLMLKHTSSLGVRCSLKSRMILERHTEPRDTAAGPVTYKVSQGFGIQKEKAEYENIARIAREQGLSLHQVKEKLK